MDEDKMFDHFDVFLTSEIYFLVHQRRRIQALSKIDMILLSLIPGTFLESRLSTSVYALK